MNFIIAAATDIGRTKDTNQDSFQATVYDTVQGKIVFAVMCDGMGGLSKGEIASSSLVKAYCKWADTRLPVLCQSEISDYQIREEWCSIASEFNEKIKQYGKSHGLVNGMGTTVTAMLLTSERYYIINVGDTRAYEISDRVTLLTKDQTVVAREVEMGNLTWEQAERDPRRSVLLQCIGASDEVYPEVFFGDTKPNTVYMLCSDGFRHEISGLELYQYLNPGVMTDMESMKQNMDFLVALNMQRMERDNISVITIRTY